MKKYIPILGILFSSIPLASSLAQEITPLPICFTIRNEAPYKVYGQMATDYYTTPDGTKARHTGTFRLEAKDTMHPDGYPLDASEFCSSGPFYPGRQMELTLRTLIPIFSCKTNIELGEIKIHGKINKDGSTKTWATCF